MQLQINEIEILVCMGNKFILSYFPFWDGEGGGGGGGEGNFENCL